MLTTHLIDTKTIYSLIQIAIYYYISYNFKQNNTSPNHLNFNRHEVMLFSIFEMIIIKIIT